MARMTPEQLVDLEEIRQLKARYFRLMDTKDWEGWRQLFTEDLTTEIGLDEPVPDQDRLMDRKPGRDGFVDRVSELLDPTRTMHHGHMPEITFTGPDTASGIWAMEDIVEYPHAILHGRGHYHERYRRVDGEWRIAHFTLTRLRVEMTDKPEA